MNNKYTRVDLFVRRPIAWVLTRLNAVICRVFRLTLGAAVPLTTEQLYGIELGCVVSFKYQDGIVVFVGNYDRLAPIMSKTVHWPIEMQEFVPKKEER